VASPLIEAFHLPDGRAHHHRRPYQYRIAAELEAWTLKDPVYVSRLTGSSRRRRADS